MKLSSKSDDKMKIFSDIEGLREFTTYRVTKLLKLIVQQLLTQRGGKKHQ